MKPRSFILYAEQWPALSCLGDEQLGRLLRHLFCWLIEESKDEQKEQVLVEPDILPVFRFLQLQIEIDNEKFQQKCEKRRAAANTRWSKNANACFAMHNQNQNQNENQNQNQNENQNQNQNQNQNENQNGCSIAAVEKEKASAAASADLSSLIEKITKGFMPWYNKMLDDYGSQMPRIKVITPDRAKKVKAIVDSYGEKALQQAMCTAAGSAFLNGRGQKNKFLASFDWIIDPTHFLDVYEGKYNS